MTQNSSGGFQPPYRSADFSPHELKLLSCGLKSTLRASRRRFSRPEGTSA